MTRNLALFVSLLGVGSSLACSGAIGNESDGAVDPGAAPVAGVDPMVAPTSGPAPGAAGGPATTNPNATALLQNPPPEPAAADIACTDQAVVPKGRLWRLSASAYKNSIEDTLGVASVDASAAPLDGVTQSGFAADASQNVVSQPWADWYFEQGDQVAAQLSAALPAQHACMTAPGATAECVQGFVTDYAARLFRRPVTAEELTRYQTAYTQMAASMTPQEATYALIQAWTMSPNHVFRTEVGSRVPGEVELTQYELASEISFLFANTAPDAALLADAEQGKLLDPAVVRAHAERLLEGPGGHEVLQNFFHEFLHQRELEGGALDLEQRTLVPSMQAETASFVENIVFNQRGGLDALLTSSVSNLDASLADFYGVSAGAAVDTGRAGLLHQAGFLNTRRDATHRGLFVRGELLCSPPASPPANAVQVAATLVFDENATGRETFEVIKSAGTVCAACHESFVPLGLSFEHYDELGNYRELDNGQVLDVTGTFPALGDLSSPFADSEDMIRQIVASDQGQLCFSKRFVSYLEGREAHGVQDGCLIERARNAMVANQLSLLSFMLELTQDPSFYRRINLEN